MNEVKITNREMELQEKMVKLQKKKTILVFVIIALVAFVVALAWACGKLNSDCSNYHLQAEKYELAAYPSASPKVITSIDEYNSLLEEADFTNQFKIQFTDFTVPLHIKLEPKTNEKLLPKSGDFGNGVYEISTIEKFGEDDYKIFFAIPHKETAGEDFNTTRIVYVLLSELKGGLVGQTFEPSKANFIEIK